MKLSDKLYVLAEQAAFAPDVKEFARLRIQCSLEEWTQVLKEAKKIYKFDRHNRFKS